MILMRKGLLVTCMAAAIVVFCAQAAAQEPFPSRPVTLVVPAAPAGLTDILGRLLAPALSRTLKQPVVVSNRPGAGGSVGAAAVAKGSPDGYNILVAITSLVTLPEQEVINERPPAFRLSELAPIAAISTEPMMLVVRPDSPYATLRDIVEDARRRAGMVSYSTTGVYGTYHVATEQFAAETGIRLLSVHYKGGGDALKAILSREVDMSLVTRSVGMAQITAGKVKPITAWGPKRWEQFPGIPSLRDEGFQSGYDLVTGLFVPVNTPPNVQGALRDAVRVAVQDAQFKTSMEKASAVVTYMDAPEFARLWERESVRLNAVIRKIGRLE